MVIQVVNFNLEGIGHQDYLGATVDVAPAFKELSGLISKVWLSDEANNLYGGVYTWENRQSMDDYLNSEFYDQVLGSNPNFINITSKSYDELDELNHLIAQAKKACNETPKKCATMHTDKALMSSTIG